jgi:multidrug efflux system membrane fusion protein
MRKLAAIAVPLLLVGCGGGGPQQPPPPDVSVAAVVRKSVTEWDAYSGHVEAIDSAEIRPRVSGHLNGIHYDEGSLVEKGQLLFTIDNRDTPPRQMPHAPMRRVPRRASRSPGRSLRAPRP